MGRFKGAQKLRQNRVEFLAKNGHLKESCKKIFYNCNHEAINLQSLGWVSNEAVKFDLLCISFVHFIADA